MSQSTAAWTLAELHRLPDDGNKYELVFGELFVTPPPSVAHETIVSALRPLVETCTIAQRLGRVHTPRSVVRVFGSEVEPDLMVRPHVAKASDKWEELPIPVLVVEILSGSTRRRDHMQKRDFYLQCGVAEYWIVDGENRTIRQVVPHADDVLTGTQLVWRAHGATEPLVIDVAALFREAIGPLDSAARRED